MCYSASENASDVHTHVFLYSSKACVLVQVAMQVMHVSVEMNKVGECSASRVESQTAGLEISCLLKFFFYESWMEKGKAGSEYFLYNIFFWKQ